MIVGLIITELGETCEGRGFSPIESLDVCRSSTTFIKKYYQTYYFTMDEDNPTYPKGCHIRVDENLESYQGYFNTNPSGAGQSSSRALCKGAKGTISKI